MQRDLLKQVHEALTTGIKLQDCYRKMTIRADNPKVKAVLHDLLLMEEMNEVLLRSLNQALVA